MTAPKCYSATFTDDVHFGIEEVQRRFPDAPLFAAGYSLGALILTKYLAEADTGKWPGQGAQLWRGSQRTLFNNNLLQHSVFFFCRHARVMMSLDRPGCHICGQHRSYAQNTS